MEIVHIMFLDKFNLPFIDFIKNHFDINKHEFIFFHPPLYIHGMTEEKAREFQWVNPQNEKEINNLVPVLQQAEKIIIHGLWSEYLNQFLFFNRKLLKKCYWAMWGGDFYFPERQSELKKQVIRRMGHLITYIEGEYELAKKWYKAKGIHHKCLMYTSNIFKDYKILEKEKDEIYIQIGNSADWTNNHFEAFEKLFPYKNENIKIYVPLSYGDMEYAEKVIKKGKELFGNKFFPMTEFLPINEYLEFLGKIDIAIFPHNRQQAMGNIITLLGLGKKVYLRSSVTPFPMFKNLGIHIFDFEENLNLEPLDKEKKENNYKKIKKHFSEDNLKNQLKDLFEN